MARGKPPKGAASRVRRVERILVAYADSARKEPLEEMPGTLAGRLASVPQRVVVAHADSIRIERVSYPRDSINDQQAPKISDVGTGQLPDGRFAVFWTTDEFADSKVELGTTSGNYTNIVSDALYVKTHVVPLTGLTIGGK